MCGTHNTDYDGFNPDQQNYLNGLLGQLDLHAAFERPNTGAPQEVTVFGTPYEDLCKEETAKLETHPWDLWPQMREHALAGRFAQDIDSFMFKHHGMFNVAPAQEGYMCRLRIPGGLLRGDQLAQLADATDTFAGGYAHLTTRGNLQVREIAPVNFIKWLERLYEMGLTSKGSGADSVRNITLSPSAGFDPKELWDFRQEAKDTHQLILNSRDLHGLPRKFNISFDGGGLMSCVSDTNDIAYLATQVNQDADVEPEFQGQVVCQVLLGGITGHQDFAQGSGWFLKPVDTVAASGAMLRVFAEHGDRTNRKKARLKYVLDAHGMDWFIERAQEKLNEEAGRLNCEPAQFFRVPQAACAPRVVMDRQAHMGVHPQRDGKFHVGVLLPVGRMTPDQMRGIAQLSQRYGGNDLRLTVWQNLLIPHVAQENVDAVVAGVDALGLSTSASSFHAGAVACTGKWACKYGSAHTKETLGPLVEHLASKFMLDAPLNIHATGCSHSCAQHYIGDIGLLGASTAEGEEAFQVYLGGGSDNDQGLARHLVGPVPVSDLPAFMEKIIQTYLDRRTPDERFLDFTRRHTEEELRELLVA
ncbi:MAG: NirA family protein [Algisphaera sp.]